MLLTTMPGDALSEILPAASVLELKFASEYVTVQLTGPMSVFVTDGALIWILGGVLSTMNVVLGPAAGARFPAVSDAVPAAMEIPSVPSPVIELSVIVRVRPLPVT